MEKEEDEFEDNNLDDIDEDTDSDYDTNNDNSNDDSDENIEESDDDNDDDVIRDSSGAEAKIQNPMWQSNEKRNEKLEKQKSKGKYSSDEDFTPSWQKPPSRMSTKDWLLTLIILVIPVVNIIMIFIWAFFSDSVAEEKKNYCRATLCLAMIMLIISIVLGIAIGGKKINVDQIKDKTSTMTDELKDYTNDAIKDEAGDAVDNYDNLTDDDFTQ
jgi:hypothetical protein